MRIKHRYYNGNVHAVSCLPSGRYWGMFHHAMTGGNSFAQGQVLGMSSHAVTGGNSFAQQQVLVSFLLLVSDVLYGRACGGGILIQTTKDNSPD